MLSPQPAQHPGQPQYILSSFLGTITGDNPGDMGSVSFIIVGFAFPVNQIVPADNPEVGLIRSGCGSIPVINHGNHDSLPGQPC